MGDDPSAAWKNKIKWYSENDHFKELNRIDGMETEFEWKIFPGLTTLGFLEKIRNLMKDLQWESEQVNDRIIFMSMYNDIVWREEGNTEKCVTNSITNAKYACRCSRGRWSFLGPGSEKKWYGTHFDKQDGNCARTAEMMMLQLHTESCHQMFVASSAFERGELKKSKAHLLLRTIISASQLSVYGAIADLCKELSEDSESSEKLEASDHLETMEIPAGSHANEQQQGTLVQDYERRFEQLSDDQKLSKLCSDAGLRLSKEDNTSSHLMQKKEVDCNIYAENTQCFDAKRRLQRKDGFARIRVSAQSWTYKFVTMKIDTALKFWSNL